MTTADVSWLVLAGLAVLAVGMALGALAERLASRRKDDADD